MIILLVAIVSFVLALALGRVLFRRSPGWLSLKPLGRDDLRSIPHFDGLTADQAVKIEKLIREVRVPAGSYVMREHHVGDALYLVVSGKVNILKRGAHDQTLVQSVGPGEFVGEMALLSDVKRIASAQTETAAVLIHVDSEDFPEFMSVSAEINRAVWSACERHAIDLMLRDHESLRALSVAERQAWMEAREAEFRAGGEVVKLARDGFFGLISGSAEFAGKRVEAPALVPCAAGQDITVTARSRVVYLGNALKKAA